jgi:hypothetical protein
VLEKLPDEHAIRAIQLDRELERQLPDEISQIKPKPPSGEDTPPAA